MTTRTEESYAIGTVARLTGVPVETLRTWERRYGVPSPTREEGGRRRYTTDEVDRLRHIGELSRLGDRVRDLAGLDAAGLDARLQALRAAAAAEPVPSVIRVAVVQPAPGRALAGLSPSGRTRLEIAADAVSMAMLPAQSDPVDVLVFYARTGARDVVQAVESARAKVGAATVVVVATYLPGPARRALAAADVRVAAEIAPSELRRVVEDAAIVARVHAGAGPRAPSVESRLSREDLDRLLNTRSLLACECASNLAALVIRLVEFEAYSRQCEADGGDDGTLHHALAEGAAEARAQMETLLLRVARHDGFVF